MISPWYLLMGLTVLMLMVMEAMAGKVDPASTNQIDPLTLMKMAPFALVVIVLLWPLVLLEMVIDYGIRK